MAIIRLSALEALVKHITCEIPELEGQVCVGQADASHDLTFPSLFVKPISWTFNPFQAEEVYDPAPDRVVMNVGYWEGEVQLQLGAVTAYQRYELEQKLIDLFLETAMAPGVLETQVTDCRDKLGPFWAAWYLESDRWEDESAFDQQFYSTIIAEGVLPALVTRKGAYTIRQLQLGITEDFNLTVDETTFNTNPAVDVVQVNEDGTISAVP